MLPVGSSRSMKRSILLCYVENIVYFCKIFLGVYKCIVISLRVIAGV